MGILNVIRNRKYIKKTKQTPMHQIEENQAQWKFRDFDEIKKHELKKKRQKATQIVLSSHDRVSALSKIKYKQALKENPKAVIFLEKNNFKGNVSFIKLLTPRKIKYLENMLNNQILEGHKLSEICENEKLSKKILEKIRDY